MAVLHTWGSNLAYHLHVHCLVTAGGLSFDGYMWIRSRDDYLVPVNALSKLFRGIFLARIRRQLKEIHLPKSVWQKDWVVNCKPAIQDTSTVLNYLARYIHRVAIRFLFSLLPGIDPLRGLFSDMCMADLSVDLWQFYMLISTLGGTIVVDESSHIKDCF